MKKIFLTALLAFVLVGCGAQESNDKVIKVGATAIPHADFLKQVKAPLKDLGYELEVVVFDDYTLPNVQLNDGTLDANYFQHIPYLTNYNKKNGTDLEPVLKVHYEPIAIYGGQKSALADVKEGDVVLVPDDATNLPRALKLLEALKWITLNDNKDTATLKDIVSKNVNITIKEVQSDGIVPLLKDVPYAIINGNYALAGKVSDRGLQKEDVAQKTIDAIVNVVAVKKQNTNSDKTKALVKAFENADVKQYIATKYAPAVTSVLGN